MGLDSSGCCKGAVDGDHLMAARRSICAVLEKSKEAALSLDKSSDRLRGMGDRLATVEAALRPLHSQSLMVKELDAIIDKAVRPAETVLTTFEIIHSLEQIIKGDPWDDLSTYLAALSQLEEAMDYLSSNCMAAVNCIANAREFLAQQNTVDKYRVYRLNERLASVQKDIKSGGAGNGWDMGLLDIALGKLDLTFRKLLLERCETITLPCEVARPTNDSLPTLPVLLPALVTLQLQTMVERLSAHKWLVNVLNIYGELRIAKIQESLQSLGPKYLGYTNEKLDELLWNDLEIMIEQWTQHIEVACIILFKSERRLCSRVFEKIEKETWIRCWGKVATGGFVPLLAFGEGVVQSQTAPEKLFKLLDMYEAMEYILPYIFEVFEGADTGCGEVRVRSRDLLKRIAHKASETIWEFGRFVEDRHDECPKDGTRSRLCSYVVNFIKYLVSDYYGPIMAKVVRIEQSWQDRVGKEVGEDKWLSVIVSYIMQSLERYVLNLAKGYPDPSLASVFLLNSLWYMVNRVKESELAPLLGDTWVQDCTRKVKKYTLEYQRVTWGGTLSHLTRDGLSLSSSGRGNLRELARQRLRNFTASLEENCHKHSSWVIPEDDLKQGIRLAVTQAVVPAYRSYTQSYYDLLEKGGSTKYIKFSPEEVETMLGDLFEIRAGDSLPCNKFNANSQLPPNYKIQSF